MMKMLFRFYMLTFLPLSLIWAGDVATFVNMGFSNDEKFFLFSQYGYNEQQQHVYAQAIFVDVLLNDYVTNGVHHHTLASRPQSGDNMDGAFFELIERITTIRKEHRINYANKGRIIYASSVMRESARVASSQTTEALKFRDFQANRSFDITLTQNVKDPKQSTFHIDFTITTANGVSKKYTVGTPEVKRHVSHYEIDRVLVSPTGKTLIFVVAMRMPTAQGTPNVRYMVEAIQIEN